MATNNLTGGCLCGGVRFELTEPPVQAGYCHCSRCRRRTGTAAAPTAKVVPGSVRVTQGEELLRAFEPEGGFPKVFCSVCGSALFTRAPGGSEPYGVRMGAFDEDPGMPLQLPPVRRLGRVLGADPGRRHRALSG